MKPKRKPAPEPAPLRFEEGYVLVASFVVGATILVVEILGTRVISPYYGGSVYVWSSLIGVTLASLAVGYWLGGCAADRWPHVGTLAAEVIGGGLFLLLIPWLRRSVLAWSTPLGLKAGSLVSAAVLFAPPLILLSMTGPLAIRLITNEFSILGRGVGRVYGISTLGSMVGAIVTGFVLIPTFPVRGLLVGLALMLLLLGGGGLLLARRALMAAGLGALALLAGTTLLSTTGARPSNVIYVGNSFYGELKVVDVRNARLLLINGVNNGFVDRATFESLAPYIAYFAYLPAARPQGRRALFIGLGAGSAPRIFHLQHRIATEVVEIDPTIPRLARRYFDFPGDTPVIVEDGRQYVERTVNRYNFVVLDAFNSETHPAHLFTREFFASVERVLTRGGIFAINMAGIPYGEPAAWRAVHATLKARFVFVRVFLGEDLAQDPTRYTNLFFVASHESLPSPDSLRGRDARETEIFARMARHEIVVRPEPGVELVLTDDYNPLDDLQRRLFVLWRQDLLRNAKSVLLFDDSE